MLCVLVLSSPLSADHAFGNNGPDSNNYVGSLPINDDGSLPFGITACGPGTTSYPVGRVFISINDKKFSRGKIFA
ncbi:hypothetical protein, partial [Candidatus Ichthyocystis hellenicum]|uniref:hypothetical protein n=1 Tax=Candidatus Ichthyocystis hellenicum TaxID=1561003 RepID=UPI0011120A94